jgi:hypothetical protein
VELNLPRRAQTPVGGDLAGDGDDLLVVDDQELQTPLLGQTR